jgi:hypothetical protein
MKISRIVTKFNRSNEQFAGEIDVTTVPIQILRSVVHAPDDDPELIFCYAITPSDSGPLRRFVAEGFDFERFEYFLECVDSDTRMSRT